MQAPDQEPRGVSAPDFSPPDFSPRSPLRFGLAVFALLALGLGGWAIGTELASAVVASGRLAVENQRLAVQSEEGGLVAEVLVEEGDSVVAGQPLLRLDASQLDVELALTETQLFDTLARRARLEAESREAETLYFDPILAAAVIERPEISGLAKGQESLFQARRENQRRELAQIDERDSQLQSEIGGYRDQRKALAQQRRSLAEDLKALRPLAERNLAPATKIRELERAVAQIAGRDGELAAAIARAEAKRGELDIARSRQSLGQREEAMTALRDMVQAELELRARLKRLIQARGRLELTAPRAGVVHGLSAQAQRSVLKPGETFLELVPRDQALVVEARIDPGSVEQLVPGQPARLRFSGFDSAGAIPELEAEVTKLSADIFEDGQGRSYYVATLALPQDAVAEAALPALRAGMPVEVYIATGSRSPLAYLMKPFDRHLARAMREP